MTATPGVDYVAPSGPQAVLFVDGQLNATVSVSLIDDDEFEFVAEKFKVSVTTPCFMHAPSTNRTLQPSFPPPAHPPLPPPPRRGHHL